MCAFVHIKICLLTEFEHCRVVDVDFTLFAIIEASVAGLLAAYHRVRNEHAADAIENDPNFPLFVCISNSSRTHCVSSWRLLELLYKCTYYTERVG